MTYQEYLDYFMPTIKHSWTWERLAEEEKEKFINCVNFERIKGTKAQRFEIFIMIYSAFLNGLGYEAIGWREK